ncbi:transglutaminase family protein [Methylocystis sp. WRRC1]|uniref:transglutaminase family protein n=1 Tax=Methylocystis sp. WRRC1 TaxID=1732014 RepID=UPI001D133BEB|nr:transglutaminase family protein [Methylocystis sp. WRRC1]
MIYDIIHITTYTYETSVASTRCAIRLTPRASIGQKLIQCDISLSPKPQDRRERVDFFGNPTVEASIQQPHARLRVALTARVEVMRPESPAPALTPSWEATRRAAYSNQSLDPASPVHWLYPSRLAPLHAPVTDYARESFPADRPVLEGAQELMRRIKQDFAYDPDATHVATPLARAFENRGGVCQDFAHIMIAGLRGIGLPAAYVSGYIRTIPAPGQPRLQGADASHAWVAIWCGEAFGWIHLDPTNAMVVGDDHIVVAIGRDYADVSPIDGVIISAGGQNLEVSVDIRTLGDP